jgi:hypothetical protein
LTDRLKKLSTSRDDLRFSKLVFEFFRSLGLNKNDNGNEKTKTITIKIIESESENDSTFFWSFSKIFVFNW